MKTKKKPSLQFISGPLIGKVCLLENGTTVLGKSQVADIVIKDNGVSRKHLQIIVECDRVKVEDLGSVNGTFVNGERIHSKVLRDGDKIHVCRSTTIKFAYCDEKDHRFTNLIQDKLARLDELERPRTDSEIICELIKSGESKTLEFKSSLRKSIDNKDVPDSVIESNVLKTLAGFLNSEGGILLVGVRDTGDILGLEHDAFKSDDDILKHVKNLIKRDIGHEYNDFIDYKLVLVNDKKLLLFECKRSPEPVYLGKNGSFYVRTNPATDQLTGKALVTYVKHHFSSSPHGANSLSKAKSAKTK